MRCPFTVSQLVFSKMTFHCSNAHFDLPSNYAFESKSGVWTARKARCSSDFRGTMRYCSPDVHERNEQV